MSELSDLLKVYRDPTARAQPTAEVLGGRWLLSEVARHSLTGLLLSHWLGEHSFTVPLDEQNAYQDMFRNQELRDGYQAAPVSYERVFENLSAPREPMNLADGIRNFVRGRGTRSNYSSMVLEAGHVAQKYGASYVVTDDLPDMTDVVELQEARYNITLVSQRYVDETLMVGLGDLNLDLIVPDSVMRAMYEVGAEGREDAYLRVREQEPFVMTRPFTGRTERITTDIALEVIEGRGAEQHGEFLIPVYAADSSRPFELQDAMEYFLENKTRENEALGALVETNNGNIPSFYRFAPDAEGHMRDTALKWASVPRAFPV